MVFFAFALKVDFARAVHCENKNFADGADLFFTQNVVKEFFVGVGQTQIVLIVLAVVDDEDGERLLVFFGFVFARHGGKLAVGLVEGIDGFIEGKEARRPHGFDEVGNVQVVFFEL